MNEPEIPKPSIVSRFRSAAKPATVFIRKRWLVLTISILLVLLGGAAGSLLLQHPAQAESNANIVILTYDNQKRTIPTAMPTVGALLKKLKIEIHKGDVVEPALSVRINQDKFRVNIYRASPVEIVDGNHTTYTFSAAASPRTVANEAGVKVYAEDGLSRGPVTNFVKDNSIGEKIVVDRATPVKLMLYGHKLTIRTQTTTVGDLLKEKDIKLKKGDKLTPKPDTKLTSNLEIAINHKGTKFVTKTETVDAPIKYISDAKLSIGSTATRQQGKDGEREVTYKIKVENGHEVSREIIQKVITKKTVETIVARGTAMVPVSGNHSKWMDKAGISGSNQGYAEFIIGMESGWNPYSVNSSSGACGLAQEFPCGKSGCSLGDAVCQLRWVDGYVQRYGGWAGAVGHWKNYHSY